MTEHRVLRLWYRPAEGAGSIEVPELEVVAGSGIPLDHTQGTMRHVTVVFEDDWKRAARIVGVPELDPVGRRANVLLSGGGGQSWLKRWARVGSVLLEIKGITAPCEVMDRYHAGLKDALFPEARAGVWCRVHESGVLAIGQEMVEAERPEERTEASAAR